MHPCVTPNTTSTVSEQGSRGGGCWSGTGLGFLLVTFAPFCCQTGLLVLFVMFWRSTSVAILWLGIHFCILSGAVSCSTYSVYLLLSELLLLFLSSLFWFIYIFVAESTFSALLTNGRHFCVTCLTKYWTFSLVILAINPWSRSKTHLLIRSLRTIITPAKKDGLWAGLYISFDAAIRNTMCYNHSRHILLEDYF